MTPNAGTLTTLLQVFLSVFGGGWDALRPSALSLFGILVGLELTLCGLWWALSGNDAIRGLIQKLLVIGLFFFFIQQWQMVCTTTLQSFARAGAIAGGASSSPGSLVGLDDPSAIVSEGLNAIQPLSDKVDALTQGTWTALKNLGTIMQIGLAMIGILFCFFLLGIQCFLVYLEFYIIAVLSLILLPFGVFRHTAFIAEKAFGAVLAHGVKLMVLAFIVAIVQPVLQQITMPADFSLRDAWCTLLAVMTICFLAWHAPSMAAGLLAGSPSLSAGHAAGAALETGGATLLGAAGIAAAGRAAANGVGATIQAASALRAGAGIGASRAAEAGAGPVGQTIGALGGAAKVVMSPLASLAQRMSQRVSDGQIAAHAAHGITPRSASSTPSSNTQSPAAGGGSTASPPSPSAASSSPPNAADAPSTAPREANASPAANDSSRSTRDAAQVSPAHRRDDDRASPLHASPTAAPSAAAQPDEATQRAANAAPSDNEPNESHEEHP